tara:strand:- start:3390 stop:3653 length:264 start_codon:yes stop_codon:yes gene_type:complete
MAQSLSFLLSSEAATARMAERKPSFVVHIETHGDMSVDDRFIELDATNLNGAMRLIDTWMRGEKYASAAMRRVMPDGTLHDPAWIKS